MNIIKPRGDVAVKITNTHTTQLLEALTESAFNITERVKGHDDRVVTYAMGALKENTPELIITFLTEMLEITKGKQVIMRRPLTLNLSGEDPNIMQISTRLGLK